MLVTPKSIFFFISFFFLYAFRLTAQEIKVGQEFPDVSLNTIINYKSGSAKISDFKGKLLILDFWATWCGPCIQMFPKCDSLQKMFGEQIQILPVTYEEKKYVDDFLKNLSKYKKIPVFPSVVNDTALRNYFKSIIAIPYYVWIDRNSNVVAITDAFELTESNIQSFLNGRKPNIRNVENIRKKQNLNKPSFTFATPVINEGRTEAILIHDSTVLKSFVFTRYQNHLASYATQDSFKLTAINFTIAGLFNLAAGQLKMYYMPGTRTRWEIRNHDLEKLNDSAAALSSKQFFTKQQFKELYTYCYERRFPTPTGPEEKAKIMLDDLNNIFGEMYGLHGSLEKRTIKCLVLVRTTIEDKMVTRIENANKVSNEDRRFNYSAYNKPIGVVLRELMMPMMNLPPAFDETGYKGNVDIELSGDINHVETLNLQLEKYGLKFIEAYREIDCVIISDTHF